MKELPQETKSHLHNQLIKLGDMMGDGLHLEPDGKWISSEYRQICKALGYIKPAKKNVAGINEHMARRTKEVRCGNCSGNLLQTRSGSKRAKCESCNSKWQLLK